MTLQTGVLKIDVEVSIWLVTIPLLLKSCLDEL